MHQVSLWSALEAEGLGANLQHFNPQVDEAIRDGWGISPDWQLKAQLVFGTPKEGSGEPGVKSFGGIEERFLKFGVQGSGGVEEKKGGGQTAVEGESENKKRKVGE